MKNKKIAIFVVLILGLSILAAACKTTTPQKPNVNNGRIETRIKRDKDRAIDKDRLNDQIGNNNMIKNNRDNALSSRAEKVAKKVQDLKEVNSATVIISGRTALVGVNIKNNIEGKLTTNLKNKIEKIVKNTDASITNVSVTADADLYKRISNMANDIRIGKPVSGFAKEFQEILRRITPNM